MSNVLKKVIKLEYFKKKLKKYTNIFVFIVLFPVFLVFTFSIKEELKIGSNDGTITLQAETQNSEGSVGYSQLLTDITVNGVSIKAEDLVRNDWQYSNLDIVEPSYSTSGDNNQVLKFKVDETVKTLSFNYAKNVNGGLLRVYVGNELLSTLDSYSSGAEKEYVTLFAPRYYGISLDNIFWYLMIVAFALVIFFFCKFKIYKTYDKKDAIKFSLTSFGTAFLLLQTSQFLTEDYVNIFSLSYYPQYKIFIPVLLVIFFTQLLIITLRYFLYNKNKEINLRRRSKKFLKRWATISKTIVEKVFSHLFYFVSLLSPLFAYFLLQNSYSRIGNVNSTSHIYNLILLYAIFLFVFWITTSLRFSIVFIIAASLIFGILNKVMIDVRDAPLMYYNLFQIQDGLNVAGNVDLIFTQRIFQSVILGCIFLSLATFLPVKSWKIGWKIRVLISIFGIGVTVLSVPLLSKAVFNSANIKLSYWRIDSTYSKNGFPLSFISYYEDAKIAEPEGYNTKEVEEVLRDYPAQKQITSNKLPNIIVIQNESQTDFTNLPEIELTGDPLRFQHSLTENTVKGNLIVSSFGGGTANTEYEILTSNSLALLSSSVFPYQQLIRSEKNSLVNYLNSLGYSTISMHPQPANNYNRKNVYNYFGFDTSYFMDSDPSILGLFDLKYERNFVSDKSLFDGIMNLYNNKDSSKPLFNFVVTMQGHGGYIDPNYPTEIEVISDPKDQFVAENEFFTTLKKTDEAFEGLVSFFKEYDEPTIIVMYGDHQPSLSETFYNTYLDTNDPSAKYKTPFVIWSNFEIQESIDNLMSPNYLVPYLFQVLSDSEYPLPISSYYQFLNATRNEVPVITTWGYIQNGTLSTETEYLPAELDSYRMIEYNNAIDKTPLSKFYIP